MWWNSETSNCDEDQKLKLWQNSKTLTVIKLKTQMVTKLKLWQNSKTQIVTKGELWQNLSCDTTQMVTTQIVIKSQVMTKLWRKKLNNSMRQNLNYDKTQELKLWQN